MEFYQRFAEAVKAARTARDMSLLALSRKVGVSKAALSKLERANGKILYHNVLRVAQFLEIDLGKLHVPASVVNQVVNPAESSEGK